MKIYIFATIILGLNLALAEGTADFKKDSIASCVAEGESQTACECTITGFEKAFAPEVWEAFMTLTNPKLIVELSEDKIKADKLLDSAEEQIKKIATDCGINESID